MCLLVVRTRLYIVDWDGLFGGWTTTRARSLPRTQHLANNVTDAASCTLAHLRSTPFAHCSTPAMDFYRHPRQLCPQHAATAASTTTAYLPTFNVTARSITYRSHR